MNIQAVVFDWAGTMVDYGSRAPVATLQSVFEEAGVPITIPEARQDMGIAKKSHIRCILGIPRIAEQWQRVRRAAADEAAVDSLYAAFMPKQLECLSDYSAVILGVQAVMEALRSRGVKIGSTTGYTRPMLDFLAERAREQGLQPDLSLCPDDVPAGRPAPWMCYLSAVRLGVFPLWQMVKIGDTPSDVEEGRNAGMWTIGITRTGNEVGLTAAEWESTAPAERHSLLTAADTRLAAAHYRAEAVADCLPLLEDIGLRIARGERP